MKNVLRRLENLEEILSNEPPPGKLSPALQAAVDRLLAGSEKTKKSNDKTEGEDA